jgi:tight adherence protein C
VFQLIYDTMSSPQTLVAIFAALAVFATAYTLVQPVFERDKLATRIKNVAVEREQLRARERARLAAETSRANLRREAKPYMQRFVDRFNLRKALADDKTAKRAWPASAARLRWSSSCSRAPRCRCSSSCSPSSTCCSSPNSISR